MENPSRPPRLTRPPAISPLAPAFIFLRRTLPRLRLDDTFLFDPPHPRAERMPRPVRGPGSGTASALSICRPRTLPAKPFTWLAPPHPSSLKLNETSTRYFFSTTCLKAGLRSNPDHGLNNNHAIFHCCIDLHLFRLQVNPGRAECRLSGLLLTPQHLAEYFIIGPCQIFAE